MEGHHGESQGRFSGGAALHSPDAPPIYQAERPKPPWGGSGGVPGEWEGAPGECRAAPPIVESHGSSHGWRLISEHLRVKHNLADTGEKIQGLCLTPNSY